MVNGFPVPQHIPLIPIAPLTLAIAVVDHLCSMAGPVLKVSNLGDFCFTEGMAVERACNLERPGI